MGMTSAQVKHRYNAAHYTQVKVSVKPSVASAFKAACSTGGESMAGTISKFMEKYSNTPGLDRGYSPNLSTKRQRRAAVRSIIGQLERICDNEESYLENIPENLQGGINFENADQCVSLLTEALEILESAY